MGDGGGGHWLVRMESRPAGWSVCLPLLIFPCTIKSRSSLLALAHPGGPGKRAVKWLCLCVVCCRTMSQSNYLKEIKSCQKIVNITSERFQRWIRLSHPHFGNSSLQDAQHDILQFSGHNNLSLYTHDMNIMLWISQTSCNVPAGRHSSLSKCDNCN